MPMTVDHYAVCANVKIMQMMINQRLIKSFARCHAFCCIIKQNLDYLGLAYLNANFALFELEKADDPVCGSTSGLYYRV